MNSPYDNYRVEIGEAAPSLTSPTNKDQSPPSLHLDLARGFGRLRHLQAHQTLYETGEPKSHVYLIETGIICLYAHHDGRAPEIVELAFPGKFLGLGFLKTHLHSARALISSRVRVIPPDAFAVLTAQNPTVKEQEAVATENEFAARRAELVSSIPDRPLYRVARFLVAISDINAGEGCDPHIFHDTLACGVVAQYLQMDIDTLAHQLVELKKRGLIDHRHPNGLALLDLQGLKDLAE